MEQRFKFTRFILSVVVLNWLVTVKLWFPLTLGAVSWSSICGRGQASPSRTQCQIVVGFKMLSDFARVDFFASKFFPGSLSKGHRALIPTPFGTLVSPALRRVSHCWGIQTPSNALNLQVSRYLSLEEEKPTSTRWLSAIRPDLEVTRLCSSTTLYSATARQNLESGIWK